MKLNLTPDPKILVALTHTPLAPLDALCELVDNAIDSFTDARLAGSPVQYPLVTVHIPTQAEIRRGEGGVQVRDNGPGLTPDLTEKALRAGFSGKDSRGGRLGLFGMGFNIATGKLGQRTRFVTARRGDVNALRVEIDLPSMQARGSYDVPADEIDRPYGFEHGTIVEISQWWPDGSPNHAFIKKLAGYGARTIAEELSRRYATILRENGIRIVVNDVACAPFEHCVWHKSRSVERRGVGRVPAVIEFDEVLYTQSRCADCDSISESTTSACPQCGSFSRRSIAERVKGWIGVQRFDSPTEFGIDLIRNGRAIRIGEKEAFFTFVDEFRREIKDYPLDSPYGRIVGEVHLDHIPVDFLKQDFQRASEEWQRAMAFLRGTTSLQPNQPNAASNESFVSRIFRAYRRVRTPGTADMYMGVWDATEGKPKRISREVEKDYYARFIKREPGYYDDAKWWELVESASLPPTLPLTECPNPECGAQNSPDAAACQVCGQILKGQACVNSDCGKLLPIGAVSCSHCGNSQVPELDEPWRCETCNATNPSAAESCGNCKRPRGAPHPASREALLTSSVRDDELSISGLSLVLADGTSTQQVDVVVQNTLSQIHTAWEGESVPLVVFKGEKIEVFIDRTHALFAQLRVRPEVAVAAEVAQYEWDLHRSLLRPETRGAHTISNLISGVLNKYWADTLGDGPERVRNDVEEFFKDIREDLPRLAGEFSRDIFQSLTVDSQRKLVNNLLAAGRDVSLLGEWSFSGEFLRHVDAPTVVQVFKQYPGVFFDGGIWRQAYSSMPAGMSHDVVQHVQAEVFAQYANCLEDCASYLRYSTPDSLVTQRARLSLQFLTMRLA